MKNKILSIIITATATLTLAANSLSVSAYDTNTGASQAQALKEINLFQGGDNGFELNREATRTEAVAMIIRFMGKEKDALNTSENNPFTDVPQWAERYTAYAYSQGISSGVGTATFGANQKITAQEFTTMLLRALGYSDTNGDFTFDNALDFGKNIGLVSDKVNTDEFLRGDMVEICISALETNLNGESKTTAELLEEAGVFTDEQYQKAVANLIENKKDTDALVIAEQGTFTAGGTVKTTEGVFDPTDQFNPQGQTMHDGHASVFYQIPDNAKELNMVFLHGSGQSRVCWQTTADGRDGFDKLFMRKGYGVYLIDQPGRGEAGQTSKPAEISSVTQDQNWYTQFRIGLYPNLYEGSQFPQGEEALDQFFRQMTPNTGSYSFDEISDAVAAVFDKSGEGVLVSHSAGGYPGWLAAIKNDNVKGVIAIEPGLFVFPEDEMPEIIPNKYMDLQGMAVSNEEFEKLTQIPIVVYYGDNIPDEPSEVAGNDFWRAELEMAYKWKEVVEAHGGDVTIVHLPKEGITGNTHFMFSDLNNQVIADHMANWLAEKGLDR